MCCRVMPPPFCSKGGPTYLDIQAILGNDELLVNLHEAVKRQNVENGVSVSIDLQGEEQKIMLTEFNQQPDGRFVDPDSGTTLTVNHYNLVCELPA